MMSISSSYANAMFEKIFTCWMYLDFVIDRIPCILILIYKCYKLQKPLMLNHTMQMFVVKINLDPELVKCIVTIF